MDSVKNLMNLPIILDLNKQKKIVSYLKQQIKKKSNINTQNIIIKEKEILIILGKGSELTKLKLIKNNMLAEIAGTYPSLNIKSINLKVKPIELKKELTKSVKKSIKKDFYEGLIQKLSDSPLKRYLKNK
jgi:hypothetical protein